MERIRAGIVGLGFIGMKHVEALRRISNVEIVAAAEMNLERGRALAAQMGIPKVYATVDEMLAAGEVDVVHVCTPTALHCEVAKKVAAAGVHLYCEKPLALNVQEAEEIREAVNKAGIANAVNLNYRMNALVQEMHERIASGESGRPFMVSGAYLQDWMMRSDDYDWRLEPSMGGDARALSDIGSHLFDMCQHVLGKPITAVCARTRIVHPVRKHYAKNGTFDVEKGPLLGEIQVSNEDEAMVMVRFADGTEGLLQVSQVAGGHKNDLSIRIDTEECSYEWHQEQCDQLHIGRRGAANEVLFREAAALHQNAAIYSHLPVGHPEGWNDTLLNAVDAFYRSIRENTFGSTVPPYATVENAYWVMKIIDACLKSSKENRWVDVATGECL